MICSKCGDELIKVPLIKMTQVVGFLGTLAFIVPMLLMIVSLVRSLNNHRINNSSSQIVFLSLDLDYGEF